MLQELPGGHALGRIVDIRHVKELEQRVYPLIQILLSVGDSLCYDEDLLWRVLFVSEREDKRLIPSTETSNEVIHVRRNLEKKDEQIQLPRAVTG